MILAVSFQKLTARHASVARKTTNTCTSAHCGKNNSLPNGCTRTDWTSVKSARHIDKWWDSTINVLWPKVHYGYRLQHYKKNAPRLLPQSRVVRKRRGFRPTSATVRDGPAVERLNQYLPTGVVERLLPVVNLIDLQKQKECYRTLALLCEL